MNGPVVWADGEVYLVTFDLMGDSRYVMGYSLAPLTDPKADEFIDSIKKLKPYEEPKVREVARG